MSARRLFRMIRRWLTLIVVAVLLVFGVRTGFGLITGIQYNRDTESLRGADLAVGDKGDSSVTNIALFGVDADNDGTRRSDCMMVLSLDSSRGKAKITSLMRDSKVEIDGHGEAKLNHSYSYGGPALAIRTINQNFDLDIEHFVQVDFSQMLDQPGYDFSAVYQYIYGNISYEVQNDYYVFPDSDARYLSNADISGMSAQELCYGKNEIYARHGRTFRSRELTDYFATKTWYYGSIAPADFNSAVFNTYENTNIKFLTDAENALTGGAGYVLDQPGYDIYAVGISDYYYDDDRLENDFIFYDSDTRYLTDEEVKGLSLQVVCYAKNEIYARRGRIFDSQELNDYFYSKPWYYGRILPEDFSSDVFNKYELANITLLDGYERALDPNGYQLY